MHTPQLNNNPKQSSFTLETGLFLFFGLRPFCAEIIFGQL